LHHFQYIRSKILDQTKLINKLNIAMTVTDLQGNIVIWNKGAERLYGYQFNEVYSKNIEIIYNLIEPRKFREINITKPLLEIDNLIKIIEARTNKNEIKFVEVRFSLIYDEENSPIGIVGLGSDITEKVLIQNQLRELNIELMEINKQLIESREKTIQDEKLISMGTMALNVAHELSQPLQYIINQLFLLEEENKVNADLRSPFDLINKQVNRAIQIITDLKNFGRNTSGIEFKKLNVKSIIDEVIALVDHQTHISNINIDFHLQAKHTSILGNQEQIIQVLINLLQNSIDALENQKFKNIDIKLNSTKDFLYLSVGDNGIGIKEEDISKIFEPFYTTKSYLKGTGLGLSIIQRIIQNHHGLINLYSEYGVGTKVTIQFPLHTSISNQSKNATYENSSVILHHKEISQ